MKRLVYIVIVISICFTEYLLIPESMKELPSEIDYYTTFNIESNLVETIFTKDDSLTVYINRVFEYKVLALPEILNVTFTRNDTLYCYSIIPNEIDTTTLISLFSIYPEYSLQETYEIDDIYTRENVFYNDTLNELVGWQMSNVRSSSLEYDYFLSCPFTSSDISFIDLTSGDTISHIENVACPNYIFSKDSRNVHFYCVEYDTISFQMRTLILLSLNAYDMSLVEFRVEATSLPLSYDHVLGSYENNSDGRVFPIFYHLDNHAYSNIVTIRDCLKYLDIAEWSFTTIRDSSYGVFGSNKKYSKSLLYEPHLITCDIDTMTYTMVYDDSLRKLFSTSDSLFFVPVVEQPFEQLTFAQYPTPDSFRIVGTDSNFCYLQSVVECDNHIDIKRGWNMVSIPVDQANPVELGSISNNIAFEYDTESNSYIEVDSLMAGKGYFLLSELSLTEPIYGEDSESIHLNLKRGWNMIGSLTDTITTDYLATIPVVEGPIYTYNNATSSYEEVTELVSGKAYWVLCTGELEVTVYPSSFFVH